MYNLESNQNGNWLKDPENINQVNTEHKFVHNGNIWQMTPHRAGDRLFSASLSSANGFFLLDYSFLERVPAYARLHIYPGADMKVPLSIRLKRIQHSAEAIQAYDSLMIDDAASLSNEQAEALIARGYLPRINYAGISTEVGTTLTKEQLIRITNAGSLPRPKIVTLPTSSSGLHKIFEALRFPKGPDENDIYVVPWKILVEKTALAASGNFREIWKQLKGY